MTFMPWTSELELGVAEIDRQHQWLVQLTNNLHDELSQPQPRREAIGEVLEGLVDYTHNHFIVEEVLFQQHGYLYTPVVGPSAKETADDRPPRSTRLVPSSLPPPPSRTPSSPPSRRRPSERPSGKRS